MSTSEEMAEHAVIIHGQEPVTRFYLESAKEFALSAINDPGDVQPLRSIVAAIAFAAMSIEALNNDLAERYLSGDDLSNYKGRKGSFKHPPSESPVAHKFSEIIKLRFKASVPDELMGRIRSLFRTRNRLVHYQVSENSSKSFLPPLRYETNPEGMTSVFVDLAAPAERVELAFVHTLNEDSAAEAYNTAMEAVRLWVLHLGVAWDEENLGVLAANHSLQARRP